MKRINSVLLIFLALIVGSVALAQAQSPTMTELIFPQWMGGDNSTGLNDMATAFYVKISGLTPSTTYKFAAGMLTAGDTANASRYGVGCFYFPEYDTSGTYKLSPQSQASLNRSTDIKTNAVGEVKLWVLIVPVNLIRFNQTSLFLCITHNNGDGLTVINQYNRIISKSFSQTAVSTGSIGSNCAFIEGHSLAPAGKYVFIYNKDIIDSTDRPLHGYMIENNSLDENTSNGSVYGTVPNFYASYVNGITGRYGLIAPLANTNGIKRIEIFNADGSSYSVATSTDGIWWPSGLNTTTFTAGSVYVMSSDDAPLPVELQTFTATLADKRAILDWQTATEVNSYAFEVQKKTTDQDWFAIGKVIAHGLSNSPKYYSFQDDKLISGTNYYRLKMLDNDGSFKYSSIVSVRLGAPSSLMIAQNYPNPFNPATVISYSLPQNSYVTLKVYDVLGKEVAVLVNENKSAGDYQINFNGSKLPSGTYVYRLSANGQYSAKKMIMIK